MRFAASSACARKVLRPSSPPLRREQAAEASVKRKFGKKSPPRGSHEAADHFIQTRGEAAKRLTIFAEENFVSKILCENKALCALRLHLRAPVKCCAPHHRRYARSRLPKLP